MTQQKLNQIPKTRLPSCYGEGWLLEKSLKQSDQAYTSFQHLISHHQMTYPKVLSLIRAVVTTQSVYQGY